VLAHSQLRSFKLAANPLASNRNCGRAGEGRGISLDKVFAGGNNIWQLYNSELQGRSEIAQVQSQRAVQMRFVAVATAELAIGSLRFSFITANRGARSPISGVTM